MADKTLESLVGGDGLMMLAPDLDYPASTQSGLDTYKKISFNPSLNPIVLSLTGKFCISALFVDGLDAIYYTVVLVVDGETIWNSTRSANAQLMPLLGCPPGSSVFAQGQPETIKCNESLTLQIFQAGETTGTLQYLARPIL